MEGPAIMIFGACRTGRNRTRAAVGWLIMLCTLEIGCSRTYYREFADDQVYEIQKVRQFDPRSNVPGRPVEAVPNTRIADPGPADAQPIPPDDPGARLFQVTRNNPLEFHGWKERGVTPIEPPGWIESLPRDGQGRVVLDRRTVLDIALRQSRDYQFQYESLYLAALDLTLAQFQFQLQPFYNQGLVYQRAGGGINESNQFLPTARAGFTRQFMSGAQLLVSFANNLVFEYNGAGFNTAATQLAVNFTQPLMRGAWARNFTQPLSLLERGVLYQLRDFARFRRGFYVDVISQSGYLGLIAQLQNIRNQAEILQALRRNLNEYNALTPQFKSRAERDQIALQVQQSEFQLVTSQANFETSLDAYKLRLGLPPEMVVELDPAELKLFVLTDPRLDELRGVGNDLYVSLVQGEGFADVELQRRVVNDVAGRLATLVEIRRMVEAELLDFQAQANLYDSEGLPIPLPELPGETIEARRTALAFSLGRTLADASRQLDDLIENIGKLQNRLEHDDPTTTWQDLIRLVGRDFRASVSDYSVAQSQIRVYLIPLTEVDLEEDQGIALALENRLDLMNARARVTDAWRNEEVAANRLLADLSIDYQGVLATDPTFDGLFRFDASAGLHRFGVQFDAPIVRRAERNAYRASQIQYQRARRDWMLTRDEVVRQLRLNLRQLRLQKTQFEISREQLIIATRQVEQTEYTLRTTTDANESQTLFLLNALQAELGARNALIGVWVSYETDRMNLYRDLDLMFLDDQGIWINEREPLAPVGQPAPTRQPGDVDLGPDALLPPPPPMERP